VDFRLDHIIGTFRCSAIVTTSFTARGSSEQTEFDYVKKVNTFDFCGDEQRIRISLEFETLRRLDYRDAGLSAKKRQ
jgi:hypothetical protein